MPSFSKEELLRLVTFSVLGIFQLLNFRLNLSTVAYKAVAYKKIVYNLRRDINENIQVREFDWVKKQKTGNINENTQIRNLKLRQ